ncbi:uncharacterized protein LOC105694382 [Orussus abietinus]|uniref:uncharacterized protein LOC105694382 n=1 Tax=Orussus abietinus TaxID=222816 RepID=UPI0006254017|nr:uncharacterized protein LOC105694382 [Orussus abietinus]
MKAISRTAVLRILVLLVTLNFGVLSSSKNASSRGLRRIHLPRAVEMSRKFPCKEPQPRAYHLRDLMQTVHQNPGESANQPVYIVLKRCDVHSGCCMSPDMSCTPVKNASYFEELEIEIWSLENNKTRRQWIRVEQHGKCTCEVATSNERKRLEHERPFVDSL